MIRVSVLLLAMLSSAASAAASEDVASLGDLSIEQLLQEPVTSVSRHEQKLSEVASAITVLTRDDLHRLGVTSVMDALRFVPGMDVGLLNASHWAISVRGFNDLYANKLLVLVDGRAVYTPLFGGVYWDLQQRSLEDIDRIEVIRGPGATVWGANAMNGVINIVTRSARDTQGVLLDAGGGDVHRFAGGGRFGGRVGERTWYRVFGSDFNDAQSRLDNGQPAGDAWRGARGGFRLDHYPDERTHLVWGGDAAYSDPDQYRSRAYNFNTLLRWSRKSSGGGDGIEVQAYYDRSYRNEVRYGRSALDTGDLEFHQTLALGARHELTWGLGYRYVGVNLWQGGPGAIAVIRDRRSALQLFTGFVQDEFAVLPERLTLTGGVKLERNDFTGLEIQPSVRSAFRLSDRQTLWAAISRAVRTPTVISGTRAADVYFGQPFTGPDGNPYVPTLIGNPRVKSEVLWAYELGYRAQLTPRLNLDVASFYNVYSRLLATGAPQAFVPGNPYGAALISWSNAWSGRTWGGELALNATLGERWRLGASYSLLLAHLHGQPANDVEGRNRGAPRHQAALLADYDFAADWSAHADLRFVDRIAGVPAYATADLRLAWRPTSELELSLALQNLLDHREQAPVPPYDSPADIEHGVFGRVVWRWGAQR